MAESESAPESSAQAPGVFENLGKKIDQRPEVQVAEEAVRKAREQLDKAQHACEQARRQAAEGLSRLRSQNLGDLVDNTLSLVRKHPGAGVLAAALAGFFAGKFFRR